MLSYLKTKQIISVLSVKRRFSQFRQMSITLETLNFDNKVLRSLPIDPIEDNYVRTVNNACFSRVRPTPLSNPRLVVYSKSALKLIDIEENQIERKEFVEYLSGNELLPGSETAAHCYCGHQFGERLVFQSLLTNIWLYFRYICGTVRRRRRHLFRGNH